jgi:hypothetical protein
LRIANQGLKLILWVFLAPPMNCQYTQLLPLGSLFERGRQPPNNCILPWHIGEWKGFFFPLFSIMFPWGSPSSQVVSRVIPHSTSDLSHMVCPKFNPHVYKLKRSAIGEHICFHFVNRDPSRCFYLGVPNVPKNVMMGQ